jgi:hypothetical protein
MEPGGGARRAPRTAPRLVVLLPASTNNARSLSHAAVCRRRCQFPRLLTATTAAQPRARRALHAAVWRNDAAAVSACLATAPPSLLEAVDSESGWTPLARALYFGHLRIAAALLAAGASDAACDAKARAGRDAAGIRPRCLPALAR